MSKRPPQRPATRGPAPADDRLSAVHLDPDAPAAVSTGAAPIVAAQGDGPVATSREELMELLGGLRRQGGLDVADEAAILRRYDGLVLELRAEKAKLEVEFRDRLARDGEVDTHAWLAEAAEALGRRQGEQMRQLVQTIPGLSPGAAA